MEEVRLWLPIALGLLSFAFTIHMWRSGARKSEAEAQSKRIASVEKSCSENAHRIDIIERGLEHIPTKEQVHRLELGVEAMKGDLKVAAEGMKALTASSTRVETYLLESASSKAA